MPTPIIKGSPLPVAKPPVYEFDPQRGYVVRQDYESAGDNLTGTAAALLSQRIPHSYTKSGQVSRISANLTLTQAGGGTEIEIDTWQIVANELEKDAKEHPTFLAMEESYAGTLIVVSKNADNHEALDTASIAAGALTAAGQLYGLLVRGTTHFAKTQYVLRHTTNVAADYSANVADANVEKIYTTAQLITECTNAASWIYPLPPRLVYKLQQIPAETARTNYLVGWRKLASSETTGANGRIDISTEYWLEQWSTVLYAAVA